jgi:hypothetical protein
MENQETIGNLAVMEKGWVGGFRSIGGHFLTIWGWKCLRGQVNVVAFDYTGYGLHKGMPSKYACYDNTRNVCGSACCT